jgi:hypothetical protein
MGVDQRQPLTTPLCTLLLHSLSTLLLYMLSTLLLHTLSTLLLHTLSVLNFMNATRCCTRAAREYSMGVCQLELI